MSFIYYICKKLLTSTKENGKLYKTRKESSMNKKIKELVNRVDILEGKVDTLQKCAITAIAGGAVIAIGNIISSHLIKVTDEVDTPEEGGDLND